MFFSCKLRILISELNTKGFLFNCTLWPNYIYRYSLPAAISFLLSEEADENDSTAHHKINLGFHWIPFKADIQEYLTFTSISLGAMVQVLLIALVYIGTNALTSTQEELKRLAFFMQQVAGVSKNVYWATNLLFDYLYFAACVSSMLLLLEIVDRSGLFSFSEHAYGKSNTKSKCHGLSAEQTIVLTKTFANI